MTMTMAPMLGMLGEAGTRLVSPSVLRDFAPLQRAQVTANTSSLGADGMSWLEYGADVPRFSGSARRLLIEGQRTNGIRNPRAQGAAIGSPGTAPTHWVISGTGSGITRQIMDTGTENGLAWIDLRFSGTNSAGSTLQLSISPEAGTANAASPGETWTSSSFVRLVGGSLTGLTSVAQVMRARDAGGVSIGVESIAMVPTGASLGSQRWHATLTMPALAAFAHSEVLLTIPAAGTIDVTLRVACPQQELAPFVSSPILPLVGSPGASTRGMDLVSTPLASLGVAGPCTVLWAGQIPALSGEAYLFHLDDGGNTNRIAMPVQASGAVRVRSPGTTLKANAGTITAGVPFAVGLSVDGTGSGSVLLRGDSIQPLVALSTDLTTLRLGSSATGTNNLFGEIRHLRVLPFAMTGSQMEAALTALD
ncbi:MULTISPECIES: hypothetical protein [Roseomonadaceae]|uniref:Uncharacterized protein n=1 Tax=Falsiroseomonas oleicola TaxID=2801474 RepID=A0ABS6HEW4_9PROT|nr:hypothetical protein [Roseomonas oleicola]MBU8547291.1 hypothetical protein [Roseomonas oleicola]